MIFFTFQGKEFFLNIFLLVAKKESYFSQCSITIIIWRFFTGRQICLIVVRMRWTKKKKRIKKTGFECGRGHFGKVGVVILGKWAGISFFGHERTRGSSPSEKVWEMVESESDFLKEQSGAWGRFRKEKLRCRAGMVHVFVIWENPRLSLSFGTSAVVPARHGRATRPPERLLSALWPGLEQRAERWFPAAPLGERLKRPRVSTQPGLDRGEVPCGPKEIRNPVIG